MQPIYNAENTKAAYQLNWSVALFGSNEVADLVHPVKNLLVCAPVSARTYLVHERLVIVRFQPLVTVDATYFQKFPCRLDEQLNLFVVLIE